jgi:hypothetical protein
MAISVVKLLWEGYKIRLMNKFKGNFDIFRNGMGIFWDMTS